MTARSDLPTDRAHFHPGQGGGDPAEAAPSPQPEARTGTDPVPAALACLQARSAELEGQPEALLELLRQIEHLHRTIQDGPFRASLPANRNALYQLLSEMERSGGWPYIPRLQLRTFLDLLGSDSAASDRGEPDAVDPSPQTERPDPPSLAA
jgi:hypothetical protein